MESEDVAISLGIQLKNSVAVGFSFAAKPTSTFEGGLFGQNAHYGNTQSQSENQQKIATFNDSSKTKSIKCLQRNWILDISRMDTLRPCLILRRTCPGKFKIAGNMVLHLPESDLSTAGGFVKLLDIDDEEVSLPINNHLSGLNQYNRAILSGFLKVTEDPDGSKEVLPKNSLLKLSKDLQSLLGNQHSSLSDVILKCGSDVFPAHKNILSARSVVFAAMFKNDMEESKTGTVDVLDMDSTALSAMMDYIYSGLTGDLTETTASQLLFAADKYQLPELKESCIDFLKSNISVGNALDILVLGDLHDKRLKFSALEFILTSGAFPYLEEQEEWKSLLKDRNDLAVELLTFIVKGYYQQKPEFQTVKNAL